MSEVLYRIDSGWIAAVLLVTMLAAIEAGYRIGARRKAGGNDDLKEHVNGLQSAVLGILALLLGFTFSLALQRFDERSQAVVGEANAIGTAALRAQLLPAALRTDTLGQLREYVDLRVRASAVPLDDRAAMAQMRAQAEQAQARLWNRAREAAELDTAAYTPILFVESVNALIDAFASREAALDRHVPELVLWLMHVTFLMAAGIVGYAAGFAGHRPSLVSTIMVGLIVVLVFIILDLDRPRRGLIQVDHAPLVELQASLSRAAARGLPR